MLNSQRDVRSLLCRRHLDANCLLLASIHMHQLAKARIHHNRLLLRKNVQLFNVAIGKLLMLVVYPHQLQTYYN
jgi:hypothetical protein